MFDAAIEAAEGCHNGLSMAARGAGLFVAQLREEDHIADRRAVGQQHDQPVDAHACAGSRRQAVFERANVISVVVHRFIIARLFRGNLCLKARGLIFSIIQLGEAIRDLATGYDSLRLGANADQNLGWGNACDHSFTNLYK